MKPSDVWIVGTMKLCTNSSTSELGVSCGVDNNQFKKTQHHALLVRIFKFNDYNPSLDKSDLERPFWSKKIRTLDGLPNNIE